VTRSLFRFPQNLMILAIVSAAAAFAAVALSTIVLREIRALENAASDNMQWTLAQTEVEYLSFVLEVEIAQHDPEYDLDLIRRNFDIFYSRITILSNAGTYAALRTTDRFDASIQSVVRFLDASVPVIDATDAELRSALSELKSNALALDSDVRNLASSALSSVANRGDERRARLTLTLIQLAIAVAVLTLTLLALSVYSSVLNIQNARRRMETIEASARMRTVTETALDAVVISDIDGRIIEFNAAAEAIFGHSVAHALGQNLGTLLVPDHHRAAHDAGMKRIRNREERRVVGKGRLKMEAKRANGDLFPVEFSIQSAITHEGEIFIAFLRDISHRVRIETELIETRDQALAGEQAKASFLATMSHEIRTPLNGLLGNLALLEDAELSPDHAPLVHDMKVSGRILSGHIEDVLDITQFDAGQRSPNLIPVRLSAVLQDIVDSQRQAAQANGTELNWQWQGEALEWISTDPKMVTQIVMNLVGNAVKFTKGGKIDITCRLHNSAQHPEHISISVQDTGIGIKPENLSTIFDDFVIGDTAYIREFSGTGLGLGIARRLATALGGTISVTSNFGLGSTFDFSFPAKHLNADPQPQEPAKLLPPAKRAAEILLVDDNEINRTMTRTILCNSGYVVTEAIDGRDCLERSEAKHFDLIFMDISMPVMDGRTATRAIRAAAGPCQNTPIIALTANAQVVEQDTYIQDGMQGVLLKPITRQTLMSAVETQLGTPTPARAPLEPDRPPARQASGMQNSIDEVHFQEFVDVLGSAQTQKLLDRFEQELTDFLTAPDLSKSKTPDEIQSMIHKLYGSAATFGFNPLQQQLRAIDSAQPQNLNRDALRREWSLIKEQLAVVQPLAPDHTET
jgi:PAS domain S-box-containing protein